jgi:hypothetical protein
MFSSNLYTPLEVAVNRAIRSLNVYDAGSEEYREALDALVKLHKMKEDEKPKPVSKDTLVIVGANLLGILMIISHERVNVVTSKAIGVLLRPRL